MKIFISQPMRGKTDDEILKERELAIETVKQKYKEENIEIAKTLFDLKENLKPLQYLAKSLHIMAECDLVVLCKEWEDARGCVIEKYCAEKYEIPYIVL